jgi:hypothetical protein
MGLFSLMLFPAPISIIVSLIAIIDINRSKNSLMGPKYGMGRAIFGLVAGIVCTLALVKVILFFNTAP